MKYIKTHDGIYYSKDYMIITITKIFDKNYYAGIEEGDDVINVDGKSEKVLMKSDDIEELCDEFALHYDNTLKSDMPIPWSTYERRDEHWEENKQMLIAELNNTQRKAIVYGAIWTDKGLIYVAKMNREGELELL